MYFAGYNTNPPAVIKMDVSQILQNEISATNIDLFLKYIVDGIDSSLSLYNSMVLIDIWAAFRIWPERTKT